MLKFTGNYGILGQEMKKKYYALVINVSNFEVYQL